MNNTRIHLDAPGDTLPFTRVSNALIRDPRLDLRMRGIMVYLLSQPPDWKLMVKDLTKHGFGGRTVVEKAILELRKLGYIFRTVSKDGTYRYDVFDVPVAQKNVNEGEHTSAPLRRNDALPPDQDQTTAYFLSNIQTTNTPSVPIDVPNEPVRRNDALPDPVRRNDALVDVPFADRYARLITMRNNHSITEQQYLIASAKLNKEVEQVLG